MDAEPWQEARLIPVSGIRGAEEQERRAVSALFAVLSAVKEFGREILRPLGAPAGAVSTYCEGPFEVNGKKVRVDGLIRVRGLWPNGPSWWRSRPAAAATIRSRSKHTSTWYGKKDSMDY